MAACDLVAAARPDGRTLPIDVADLQLHEVHLGVAREQLIEQFGRIVVGEAHTADAPLLALAKREVEAAEALGPFAESRRSAMHQVAVEPLHAAAPQLLVEDPLLLLRVLDEHRGQLVGQTIGLARIALHERAAQGLLARTVVVGPRRIEISEAPFECGRHHPGHLLPVDRRGITGLGQRQAHAAQPQFFLHRRPIFSEDNEARPNRPRLAAACRGCPCGNPARRHGTIR